MPSVIFSFSFFLRSLLLNGSLSPKAGADPKSAAKASSPKASSAPLPNAFYIHLIFKYGNES